MTPTSTTSFADILSRIARGLPHSETQGWCVYMCVYTRACESQNGKLSKGQTLKTNITPGICFLSEWLWVPKSG